MDNKNNDLMTKSRSEDRKILFKKERKKKEEWHVDIRLLN